MQYPGFFQCSFVLAVLLASWPQAVQAVDVVPQNTMPGAVFRYEDKNNPTPIKQLLEDNKEMSPEIIEKQAPKTEDTPSVEIPKVFIKKIHLPQSPLLQSSRFANLLPAYEGRDVEYAELEGLCSQLNALLREDGYVTSSVYLPPQHIVDGEIALKIQGGRLGKIQIKEGRHFGQRFITPRLRLKDGDLLDMKALRASLREMNQNPDAVVGGELTPGDNPGETDLIVSITEKRPYHFSFGVSNLGRRLIGDGSLSATLSHNNLLGFGDQLSLSSSVTARSWGAFTHYEVPVGKRGTVLGVDYGLNRLKLGRELKSLDVEGHSYTLSPFIRQTLYTSESSRISADLAFDVKAQDTNILGADFTRDQLRALRGGLNVLYYTPKTSTFFRQELALGVDAFGAGNINRAGVSNFGAGGAFFRATGNLYHTRALPGNVLGVFRLMGQASPDSLVSLEQFQVGGAYTVRGYREGQYIGDNGLLASLELRFPLRFIPESYHVPFSKRPLRDAIQLVAFTDFGAVFSKAALGQASVSETLLGVGAGLRLALSKSLTARLDLALPLLRAEQFSQRPRLHFGVDIPLF